MEDATKIYLKELHNEHSTKEESMELIALARSGDSKAQEKIIKNYLLLVVKIANEYKFTGVPYGDLLGEGNLGLLVALEKYDPERGHFSTCAKLYIRQGIIRNCMHKKRIVRLPENISELMRSDRWTGEGYSEISIDKPNEEGDTLSDVIPDKTDFNPFSTEEAIIMKHKVEKLLSFLNKRDADVIKACFGIDRIEPLEVIEAAETFGLSTTRINQILRNSLKRMKISHEDLPDTIIKNVEIISATYGADETFVNVTDKVVDLYLKKENIKSCNKLGGDPCPGIQKNLIIQYIYEDEILSKRFGEGAIVKF
jgi:RNA polymerase primary sigma factor